jgi:Zn-dependent protease
MSFDPVIIYQLPILLLALSFHEMSHGWVAERLGDPTARSLGRITLDPRPHIDPVGTLLFPLLLALSGLPVFGWAKPVPYNPRNLSQPGRDDALIAAAGPLSNLLLAIGGAIVFRLVIAAGPVQGSVLHAAAVVFFAFVLINLILCLFNLIPVPPLDGGGILVNLLPDSMAPVGDFLRTYGFLIFILLIFTGLTRRFVVAPAYEVAYLFGGIY